MVLLWKAFGPRPDGNKVPPEFFRWLGIDPPPDKGEYFVSLYPFIKEHIRLFPEKQLNAIYDEQGHTSYRPWTAKQYQLLADWLRANEKPVNLVELRKRVAAAVEKRRLAQ